MQRRLERALAVLALLLGPSSIVLAAPRTFRLDPERSLVTVRVGKAGLLSFAGHEHRVLAPAFEGTVVVDPENLAESSVVVRFQASRLEVSPEGEPEGDAPKVQSVMLGPKVLDASRFPAIRFRSTEVRGRQAGDGRFDLEIRGELTLHGSAHPLETRVRVRLEAGTLTAEGRFGLRQSDWGIKRVSVAGLVKVKDEVRVEYRLVATASLPSPASR